MNRDIIIALLLLIVGLIIRFVFESDFIDLIAGLLIGLGIGLILKGRMKIKSKNAPQ